MKLRLLLFEKCNRKCPGCCNKQWNLDALPIEDNYKHYDKIILTGGEPMLDPFFVIEKIKEIKKVNDCPVIVYTAKVDEINSALEVLKYADGMTLTLHDKKDYIPFLYFNAVLGFKTELSNKSLRLNVFKGVDINPDHFPIWKCKTNIEWIDNCPLPENEVFCRV